MPQHPVDESTVRTRLRVLMGNDGLPAFAPRRWVATVCEKSDLCVVCRATIDIGATEFEVVMPGDVVLYLHRRCFELWAEVAADGDGHP